MQRRLKQLHVIAMWLISTGLAVAQSTSVAVADADQVQSLEHQATACAHRRGCLIRSDSLGSATRVEVAQGLAVIGWSDVAVRSGITLQRLVYTTIDARGEPTIASGLLALPTDVEPVGVVSFGHGTDSLKSYVPSAPTGEGLGSQPSSHPAASRWSQPTTSDSGSRQGIIRICTPPQRRAHRSTCSGPRDWPPANQKSSSHDPSTSPGFRREARQPWHSIAPSRPILSRRGEL
jgi:hypothetical protein